MLCISNMSANASLTLTWSSITWLLLLLLLFVLSFVGFYPAKPVCTTIHGFGVNVVL